MPCFCVKSLYQIFQWSINKMGEIYRQSELKLHTINEVIKSQWSRSYDLQHTPQRNKRIQNLIFKPKSAKAQNCWAFQTAVGFELFWGWNRIGLRKVEKSELPKFPNFLVFQTALGSEWCWSPRGWIFWILRCTLWNKHLLSFIFSFWKFFLQLLGFWSDFIES